MAKIPFTNLELRHLADALRRTGLLGGGGTSGDVPIHGNTRHSETYLSAADLSAYEVKSNKSTNTALGTSDTLYPSQKAVKTYVDTEISELPAPSGGGDYRLTNDGCMVRDSDTQLSWDGYQLGLWSPTDAAWVSCVPSSTPVAANTANDLDSNALTYDANYDVFAEYVSATSFNLVFKKFSSGNTRAVTPAKWQGRYCYDNTTDAGKSRLWLGTVRLRNDGGTAKFTDTVTQQFVSSLYNEQIRYGSKVMSGNSWTHNSTTLRPANNDSANKLEAVFCQSTHIRVFGKHFFVQPNTGTNTAGVTDIGIDSTNTGSGTEVFNSTGAAAMVPCTYAAFEGPVSAGYHAFYILERTDAANNVTFASYGFGFIAMNYQGW